MVNSSAWPIISILNLAKYQIINIQFYNDQSNR